MRGSSFRRNIKDWSSCTSLRPSLALQLALPFSDSVGSPRGSQMPKGPRGEKSFSDAASADTDVAKFVAGDASDDVAAGPFEQKGRRILAHLRAHCGRLTMTTDEIMALTRGD